MKLSLIGKCGECALRAPNGVQCMLDGRAISAEDFCSNFKKTLIRCDICGHLMGTTPILETIDNTTYQSCPACNKAFGTCPTCDQARICPFETDPSPIPKVVQRKVQQGPMIAVTDVRNPERIRITCEKNCKCYDASFGCLKQTIQTCKNFSCSYKNGGST